MGGKKVDEDGLNYLVWAKNNKLKHDDILAELADHDIEISGTRISQLYLKNKFDKSKGLFNPYDPEPASKLIPASPTQPDTETIIDSPPESVHTEMPTFETENGGSYMIDLKPILNAAGIRTTKNTQVIKLFERSPGTPRDLQETLDILAVGIPVQKQIIAQAYGMEKMKEIYGIKSKLKPQSFVSTNSANPQQMVNNLVGQKIQSLSNRIALKDVEATLSDLEGRPEEKGEDVVKTLKEIAMLKALQGSDNNSNIELFNKLIIESVKSKDNQLIPAIEIMNKLQNTGSKEQDTRLKYMMDEAKLHRESAEKSREQYMQSEKERMTLMLEQMKAEAARNNMSFDDYTNQIANSVQLAQKMGMVPGQGSDQQDAIKRLQAGTQLAETFSTNLDTGIDKLGARIEGGINILVDLLERRDQRMEARTANQNNTGLRELPPREQGSVQERDQALNTIGSTLQNAERLRAIHDAFKKIKQS